MPESGFRFIQKMTLMTYGFRPFFLFGSLFASLSVLLWLQILDGELALASLFAPTDWHSHEMLFGFAPAIITGFLLTAIPNWTGRLPVRGGPLLILISLWFFGRFAVYYSAHLGWVAATLIDCSFLTATAFIALREIVAGKNWRNLKILVPIAVLLGANILFHLEAHFGDGADFAKRLGLSAILILIMLIGGRIIPSFTRNWLAKQNPGRLPVPFNRFDLVVIAISAFAFVGWTLVPSSLIVGAGMLVAAALHLVRLGRWAGYRILANPLLVVLHTAYLFFAIGFLLSGLAILMPDVVGVGAGVHAFSIGTIGMMTLSVMVRATLGHTGRPLRAGGGTAVIFVALVLSVLVRIVAALEWLDGYAVSPYLISIAGYCWAIAFGGFALLYGKALLTPRRAKK